MPARRRAVEDIQRAVSVVVRTVRSPALARTVEQRVGTAVDGPQPGILPYISRAQPVRVSDLAQMMRVEIPTVSRQLKILSERGLIARTPHPDDGRSSLVSFTPKGRATFDRLFEGWLDTLDEVVGDWADAEVVAFADQLHRFAEALTAYVVRTTDTSATV
jgi:DNA-binding MarR family transcriptional regulator